MIEWLKSVVRRLHARARRRQLERDFQDEIALHLSLREAQLRASGSPDAPRAARHAFGSTTKIGEDLRETWRLAPATGDLLRDLRYAARSLGRAPGFTAVVLLTLGLGIGANTAFFSVVNAVLIRPLGYANADRLVSVLEGFPQAHIDRLPFSALDFDDFQRYQQSFDAVAAYRSESLELSGSDTPEQVSSARVSTGLFELLGVAPVAGRAFGDDDDRPDVSVAILSWALWHRHYGADPSIVGRTIQLGRRPYTVVGIMPASFVFPRRGPQFSGEPADIWTPLAFTDRERRERASMQNNNVIGRLRPGVTFRAAEAELEVLAGRIAENYPAPVLAAGFAPRLFAQRLRNAISGRIETPLLILLAAVGTVLLVACANIASLLLSRTTVRSREFAVRTALGAGRGALARLLMCEALLLSVSGGLAGLAVAYGALSLAPAVLMDTVPGLHSLTIDARVLAFTTVICLMTTAIFVLIPLATIGRLNPERVLRTDSSRTTQGASRLRLQRAFVVSTIALACVLLVGSGLLTRSFAALIATDIGFRPTQVLTAETTLPRAFYASAASVRTFHDAASARLGALPGVHSVSVSTDLPLSSYETRAFTPEGLDVVRGTGPTTTLSWVHGPFFETLGIALRAGRFFTSDDDAHNRNVVIVNERLAALAWPGQTAVGRRLKWGASTSPNPWLTVVGVIGDVADGPIGLAPQIHAYEPFRQFPDFFLNGATNQFGREVKFALLADGDSRTLAPLVRSELQRLDPSLAIEKLQPLTQRIADVLAPRRFSTQLVGAFAAVAMLLASIGVYGLLAFTIALRRREIAVRMALGADRYAVVYMIVRQGGRLIVAGLVLGTFAALLLAGLVASELYKTPPRDVLTFAAAPGALAATALAACVMAAWRAARVEPIAALGAE